MQIMLLNNLYTIRQLELLDDPGSSVSVITAEIELNPRHPLFKGHFPGNPILPGVCTVQVIRELMEQACRKSLMMKKAGTIKYLGFVNPETMPVLKFMLKLQPMAEGRFQCSATVSAQEMGVCSFKGEFS
jgi:3-hydroxyacyl-[acyl-carrier-protein] dehydratase